MDVLKKRLDLREQQIIDMKSQISSLSADTSSLDSQIEELQRIISNIDEKIQEKDKKLDSELSKKEEALARLQQLESQFGATRQKKVESKKTEKNQDVATAYIEFYTRTVQNKPMFKKLPEFTEDSEPYPQPTMNDTELDEELEKLGLSDVLKKYS